MVKRSSRIFRNFFETFVSGNHGLASLVCWGAVVQSHPHPHIPPPVRALPCLVGAHAQMMYGRLYLNSSFFKELAQRFKRNIVLILAEKDGKVRTAPSI